MLPVLSSVAAVHFDRALMAVSEFLAEARCSEETGHILRAHLLYAMAEHSAIASGYTELIQLVWAYQETPPASLHADRAAEPS
jgi:hypothetical protein